MRKWCFRVVGIRSVLALMALGFFIRCGSAGPPASQIQAEQIPATQTLVSNAFTDNNEGWFVYDYDGGLLGGSNVFYPATVERSGGIQDSGYIYSDDSKWRIDTPENPNSILAFITYREWVGGNSLDLRDAHVSFYLRGDNLDLKGAKCFFWVFGQANGTRWHYYGEPLQISDGVWSDKQTIILKNDKELWHRSWSRFPDNVASLDEVLSRCHSYGFSFVGFSDEVTGKFAMDQFKIEKLLP